MTRFQLIAGLVPLALAFVSGCHCIERTYSPAGCCGSWDPVLGSCHECGLCGGDCEGHTPCSYLKHQLTCAAGCGEIYWGEWLSDPPARCDPCDNYGNWVGHQGCPPTCWEKLTSWKLGGSHAKGGGCAKSCRSCTGGSKGGKGKGAPGSFTPPASPNPLPPEPVIEEVSFEEAPSDEIPAERVRPRPRRRFQIRSTRLR